MAGWVVVHMGWLRKKIQGVDARVWGMVWGKEHYFALKVPEHERQSASRTVGSAPRAVAWTGVGEALQRYSGRVTQVETTYLAGSRKGSWAAGRVGADPLRWEAADPTQWDCSGCCGGVRE